MDSMVTPQNSIVATDTMTAFGSADVLAIDLNPTGTHETCFIPTTRYALNWFDSLSVSCQMVTSIAPENELRKITFYPNPVSNILTCNSDKINFIQVYNFQGEMVLESYGNTVNMSNLNNGMYLVIAFGKVQGQAYYKKIIKN